METVYLDTETTGLDADDEIIEIGILSDEGLPLVDTLVRPLRHTNWPTAQMVNGISPDDVADAPLWESVRPQVIDALAGKQVIIYNADFDRLFLPHELRHAAEVACCMWAFAEHYGEWRPDKRRYQWKRLEFATEYFGYAWPAAAHRAITDCAATRVVWHCLLNAEIRNHNIAK